MKLVLCLLLSITVLLADSIDIFDYKNYQGHTDFTDYDGEHHSGEQFNRTKYVLEKLAKENKIDLIKEEFKKLKIGYQDDFDNEYVLGKAAAKLIEQLPENADDIAKKQAGAERDKKALQADIFNANQYFKKNKLFAILKIKSGIVNGNPDMENYNRVDINLDAKITITQKQALIKTLNLLTSCKEDHYGIFGRFGESLTEKIEGYLVHYTIKNKDEGLMKSILFKKTLAGNGCNASYSEYITQNQYLPFYLHYPNIDKYLDQKEIDKATNRILDVMELYNETTGDKGLWAKYNSTFIFPDEGKEKEFKFKDFIKMVEKQSPRLANDVMLSHIFSVLSVNGLMNEDDTNTTIEK